MLHVFYVNVGSMLKYELDATKNNVSRLQDLIAKQVQMPMDKQILLISGGENVCPGRKISSYSSGSDTTPFFLYHKNSTEVYMPPLELSTPPSEKSLQTQLKESMHKSTSADVTSLRANIVKSFYLLGRQKLDVCSELVHSQHLQHQGWAVVIANLLDVTSDYLKKGEAYMENLNNFQLSYDDFHKLLKDIPHVINTLDRIQLPPCLPIDSSHHSSFNLSSSTSSTSSSPQHFTPHPPHLKIYTLLDWINTHDSRTSLQRLVEDGRKSLQEFNEDSRQSQDKEMESFKELVLVDRKEMKVIRGLDDRLSGLDRLMANNKRLLKEQEDMAEMFSSVHHRLQSVQDSTMLAELCAGHKEYLERVHNNHTTLVENLYKCYKTKHELCENLNNRLRWVMLSEQTLWQADNRLLMRHKKLTKLRHKLHILHQIRSSTGVYCRALVEVVRRRSFCTLFMKKASVTSSLYSEVHKREVEKRKAFEDSVNIQEHFLKALFPGLRDEHPSFASRCPEEFDRNLPEIGSDTIQSLLASVPELAVFLEGLELQSTDPLLSTTSEEVVPSEVQAPKLQLSNKQTQTDNLYAAKIFNDSNEKFNEKSNSSSLSKSYEFIQDRFEQTKLVQSADNKALLTVASTSAYTTPLSTPPIQITSGPFQAAAKASKTEPVAAATISSSFKPSSVPIPFTSFKHHQHTPDNSPIDSFLTADFYFDESMQSSDNTDPSTSKKVMELQSLLQERFIQLERREKEVKELLDRQNDDTEQIDTLVERYKKLAEFCFDGFNETKSFLVEVKNDHLSFIQTINGELVYNKNNFERLAEDIMILLNTKEADIIRLNQQLGDLSGSLTEKDGEIKGLREECGRMEERLGEEEKRFRGVIQGKDSELVAMEGRYSKLVLESELEMEGLKCEFAEQLREKEGNVAELEGVLERATFEIERVRKAGEMALSEARNQCEIDRREEIEALEKKFEERLSYREDELKVELNEEHEDKMMNKLALVDADHKLKLAVLLGDLRKLKAEVNCFKEDLQNNEHNDCVISDSTEFISMRAEEDEDGKDEASSEFREVSEMLRHVRVNLTSLLEQISKLKEQSTQKDEEIGRLRSADNLMPSVYSISSDEPYISTNACFGSPPRPSSPCKDDDDGGDEECVSMSTSTTDLHGVITLDRHHELLKVVVAEKIKEKNDLIEDWKKENLRFCEDLIANMKSEHEGEVADMRRRLKCELEEQRQIAFNRALQQALRDRDEHIAMLEAQLVELKKAPRPCHRSNINSQPGPCDKADQKVSSPIPSSSSPIPSSSSQPEPSSPPLPRHTTHITPAHPSSSSQPPPSTQSSSPAPTTSSSPPPTTSSSSSSSSSSSCSPSSPPTDHPLLRPPTIPSTMIQSCPDYLEKVHQLKSNLKIKEEENKKLRNKLSSTSKLARGGAQDFVNIKSCTEGSTLLFVQDTNTQHYVAYLPSSPIKYFLHSDSLPLFQKAFSLMPSWIVAEVTGKDLCQAKKSSNRFRVSVGSKFYRVKAKPCPLEPPSPLQDANK